MFCFFPTELKSLAKVQIIIKKCHLKSTKVFPKWVENLAKNFVMIWWKVNLVFRSIDKILFCHRIDQWIVVLILNIQLHLIRHHDPSEIYRLVTFGIPINSFFAWIRTIGRQHFLKNQILELEVNNLKIPVHHANY